MKRLSLSMLMMALLVAFCFAPMAIAEEPPPADKPKAEEKADKPADVEKKEGEEYDWKIGEKITGEFITNLVENIVSATQQKGSFWRNPALWEVVLAIVLAILGIVAAKLGWNKKKWGHIIKVVQSNVQTVYMNWVREAKVKAKEKGGKLSKEDMLKALQEAWDLSKQQLMNEGIDLAKWIAREYFPVIVNKLIKTAKKDG